MPSALADIIANLDSDQAFLAVVAESALHRLPTDVAFGLICDWLSAKSDEAHSIEASTFTFHLGDNESFEVTVAQLEE